MAEEEKKNEEAKPEETQPEAKPAKKHKKFQEFLPNPVQPSKDFNDLRASWRTLDGWKKSRVIWRLIFTLLPMVAYIFFCAFYLYSDAQATKAKYYDDSVSPSQQAIAADLSKTAKATDPDSFYCDVTVGTEIISITNISPANSSFQTEYNIWFDFEVRDLKNMVNHLKDYDATDAAVTGNPDNYSPYLPAQNFDLGGKSVFNGTYPKVNEKDSYYNWDSVSGKIDLASKTGTLAAPYDKEDSTSKVHTRCRQVMKVIATVHKDFDSPRYPLESLQFTFFISPTYDSAFYRYNVASQGNLLASIISPTLTLSEGFTLVQDESKQLVSEIYYYKDVNTDPTAVHTDTTNPSTYGTPYSHAIKTELQISIRANRTQGWSLFLQAFLTLFAVMIWNFISFYNAAFNKEDALGTLGAGLFSAVSSVLIGLSLISDSQGFALVNMVNIFALLIILLMTFIIMKDKRAHVKDDVMEIASQDVYMKIVFYVLLLLNLCCFVLLPCISFLWGL